jgi:hypothetical protein
MAMGMWHYHTLQYAVKATGAYISHHGDGCASPNTCSIQIKDAASVLKTNAIGIPANEINVIFTGLKSDHTTASTPVSCRLDECVTNTTAWPPAGYTAVGSDVEVRADYVFKSALCMFVPGSGVVKFGQFDLPGYTHQFILF